MTLGRQKRVKRHLMFYRTRLGLTPPIRVLVDTSFVELAIKRHIDIRKYLSKLLQERTWPVITQCVVSEIGRILGDEAVATVSTFQIVPCPRHSLQQHEADQYLPTTTNDIIDDTDATHDTTADAHVVHHDGDNVNGSDGDDDDDDVNGSGDDDDDDDDQVQRSDTSEDGDHQQHNEAEEANIQVSSLRCICDVMGIVSSTQPTHKLTSAIERL
jgi:hypothetical protein